MFQTALKTMKVTSSEIENTEHCTEDQYGMKSACAVHVRRTALVHGAQIPDFMLI